MIHSNVLIHINRLQNNSSMSSHKYKNTILTMTYHAEGNTRRLHVLHVSVTERVLTWRSPRAFLNVNKCFSCILNGVRSLNSQRRRKDGQEKREGDRLRRSREGKRGRACMCPCACSLVQKCHCHYKSLSAVLEQGCHKAARTWVSRAPLPLTQTSCTLSW